jgi:hypothetical protein
MSALRNKLRNAAAALTLVALCLPRPAAASIPSAIAHPQLTLPAVAAPSPPTLPASYVLLYVAPDGSWQVEFCRNDPVNVTDPTGLAVQFSENLGFIPGGYAPYIVSDASLLSKDSWEHLSSGAYNIFALANNTFYGGVDMVGMAGEKVDDVCIYFTGTTSAELYMTAQSMGPRAAPGAIPYALNRAGSGVRAVVAFLTRGRQLSGASASAENAAAQVERQLAEVLRMRARQLELAPDAARGMELNMAQGTGGARLERALGRALQAGEHEGIDFVDRALGPISLKGPIPVRGSVAGLAKAAIADAMGGNAATRTVVIDTLGLTESQVAGLKAAIEAGTKGTAKKIIYLQ